jgi:hypothetical protein
MWKIEVEYTAAAKATGTFKGLTDDMARDVMGELAKRGDVRGARLVEDQDA